MSEDRQPLNFPQAPLQDALAVVSACALTAMSAANDLKTTVKFPVSFGGQNLTISVTLDGGEQPAKGVIQQMQTALKPCPMGKTPCALHAPNCNFSPGLYVVEHDGKQVDMCGICQRETGATVIAQAR